MEKLCNADMSGDIDERIELMKKSLNTIKRIFRNIINKPDEPRYQYLKKSTKLIADTIFAYPTAIEIVKLCGFEETDPILPDQGLMLNDVNVLKL